MNDWLNYWNYHRVPSVKIEKEKVLMWICGDCDRHFSSRRDFILHMCPKKRDSEVQTVNIPPQDPPLPIKPTPSPTLAHITHFPEFKDFPFRHAIPNEWKVYINKYHFPAPEVFFVAPDEVFVSITWLEESWKHFPYHWFINQILSPVLKGMEEQRRRRKSETAGPPLSRSLESIFAEIQQKLSELTKLREEWLAVLNKETGI